MNKGFRFYFNLFLFILFATLFSCTGPAKDEERHKSTTEENLSEPIYENSSDSIGEFGRSLEVYSVKLAINKSLKLHEKGVLKIWIGDGRIEINFGENTVQDETIIPANIGHFAKIKPFAPSFDISPKSIDCIKIDPSGSAVRFILTPKDSGELEVSADIELFYNSDCSGTPVPKSAETLTVFVDVDHKRKFMDKLNELWAVFWEKFLSFWGALIALFFAALLFVIRSKIKKKTGYSDSNE